MKVAERRRFKALVEWSCQHGAELHPSLEIYHDNVTGFSFRARNSLEPGFRAVACPVSTTLSYLNAVVDGPINLSSSSSRPPAAFPARFMETTPPHVIGRFFLIKEFLNGRHSFWSPYIATLPQPDHVNAWALPAFWPDGDVAYLEGTNAHTAMDEIQANVKSEFRQARRVLKEDKFPDWHDYTLLLYKWAFCIFTSRSFRPSLILSPTANQHVSRLLPEGCVVDDFSILQPLFDIANYSMTSTYTWDVTSDQHLCQLICGDTYRRGDQVYNNYGLKSNSELLLGYGFILPETEALHNDYVHVRKRQQHDDDEDGGEKPMDFLISLRPMNHPSSLAGRARLAARAGSRLSSLAAFARFEPALVDDLASALATPEQKQVLDQWLSKNADESVFQPPEVMQLVERVKATLAGKLQYDYQRLRAAVEMGEEGGDGDDGAGEGEGRELQPTNRNQQLAVEYRRQCERVLLAALEGLAEESGSLSA